MIHLNTTSFFGTEGSSNTGPASFEQQTPGRFQQDLSAALSATIKRLESHMHRTPDPAAPATVSPDATAPETSALTSTSNPVTATDPGTPVAGGDSGNTPEVPAQSFDDAYWAKQPPAVQALRTMTDYDQRMNLVSELTAQGYNIDVPIMAWGWDPAKVTAARQSYGYTWVPSAMQKPIAEAPGVSLPGVEAYDPKKPPAGSIAV